MYESKKHQMLYWPFFYIFQHLFILTVYGASFNYLFLLVYQGLDYADPPDYNYLQSLLLQCKHRKGVSENDLYDWEDKIVNESSGPSVVGTTTQITTQNGNVSGLVNWEFIQIQYTDVVHSLVKICIRLFKTADKLQSLDNNA